ncbi:MAG: hypothetical protein WCG04_05850, partial [Alphaproteobacteria bacterium]
MFRIKAFFVSLVVLFSWEAGANAYEKISEEVKQDLGVLKTTHPREAALYYVFKSAELFPADPYRGWIPDKKTGIKNWKEMIASPLIPKSKPFNQLYKPSRRSNAVNIAATFLNMHEGLLKRDATQNFFEIKDHRNDSLQATLQSSLNIVAGKVIRLSKTTVATPEEAAVYVKTAYLKGIALAAQDLMDRRRVIGESAYGTSIMADALSHIYDFNKYGHQRVPTSFAHCFILATITRAGYLAANPLLENDVAFIDKIAPNVPEKRRTALIKAAQAHVNRLLAGDALSNQAVIRKKYEHLFSNPVDNSGHFGVQRKTHQFVAYRNDVNNINQNKILDIFRA